MPSALETLVKILKLEREQGYRDSAVIGGLASFAGHWQHDAHSQARRPEHHILVDELNDLLSKYEQYEQRDERHQRVGYMLDRITGRVPAPPTYIERLALYEVKTEPPLVVAPAVTPEPAIEQPATPPKGKTAPAEKAPKAELLADAESKAQEAQEAPKARPKNKRDRKREENTFPEVSAEPKPAPEMKASVERPEPKRKRAEPKESKDDLGGDDFKETTVSTAEFSQLDEMEFSSKPQKRDLPPPARLARPPRHARPVIDMNEAVDVIRGLNASVERIKGIGPKQVELLARLNIRTINDLLFYFPSRYDDYTQMQTINRLQAKMRANVIGTVRETQLIVGAKGRRDFFMRVEDGTASIGVTCFGQAFLRQTIKVGQQVLLRGQTSMFQNRIQLTNPEIQIVDLEDLQAAKIIPVYPLTEGLNNRQLRKIIEKALDFWAERIPDYIPENTLERLDLADLGWALRNIHFPEGMDHRDHAQNRLIFDQLLMLQLTIMANRRKWQSIPARALDVSDVQINSVITAIFPYPLTGAQRRSIEEIRQDVVRPVPMNRLLQGDVGSGKTAVAAAALVMAFLRGTQATLMAPTSILAEQHYRGISAILDRIPDELLPKGRKPVVGLLTGSISNADREAVYQGLSNGSIDIAIGTHAVIQSGVEFQNLSLAIIDEQHRFGVEQRGALRGKGTNPHLLVMTATPIPRTLALTMHADLDLSVIDEMPPGRMPVKTRVIEPPQVIRAYELITDQINLGRQAFIVYPLVEASDRIDAEAAVDAFEEMKVIFHRHRVGLLHGRMRSDEKDAIMNSFRNHEFDLMITTSVAEVGVDIPNASVILIMSANRFGLAQLHQFRGRVGRGGFVSYCLLVCDSDLPEAIERLIALERTNNGFELADIDWKLRGAGDLIGTQQSGHGALQLTDKINLPLVEQAQREARTIYAEDPDLNSADLHLLATRIRALQDARSDVS